MSYGRTTQFMNPITNPEKLKINEELVYSGSDGQWHYAEVLDVSTDSVVVWMPVGNRRFLFSQLTNPDHWRHR